MKPILDSSIESEQAVLGALLVDPYSLDAIAELRPEWFYLQAHQEIVATILRLRSAQQPVDPVSVHQALQEFRKIPDVVPAEMVFSLAKGLGTAANVGYYLAQVRKLYALRQARILTARFSTDVDLMDPEAAIGALQRDLAAIESGRGFEIRSMDELTLEYLGELEQQAAAEEAGDGAASVVSFNTGFERFDRYTGGIRPGVLQIWAARAGAGKTSFETAAIAYLARTGVPVAAFWLEDDRRDAVRRYHQAANFVAQERFRGRARGALDALAEVAQRDLEAQRRIFIDDTHGITANEMAARMRRYAREKGVRVFFADHLGEVGLERDDRWGDRHDLALGRAARIFRDAGKELNAGTVLLCQLNRLIERRADPTPKMSDLDGSGQIEQAARVIAVCSQGTTDAGEPDGNFWVDLTKNTNGPKGRIRMKFIPERMTITD